MAEEIKEQIVEPIHIEHIDLSKLLIDNPVTFAEKILGDKAVGGSITIPIQMHSAEGTQSITTTIPFFVGNDFSVGTFSNKWGQLTNMDFANTFAEWTNALQSIQGESQVALQSENMSSKVWKGSEYSGLSVDCLFVSTRRSFNPLKIITNLAASALPSKLPKGETTTAQGFVKTRDFFANKVIPTVGNLVASGISTFKKEWAGAINKYAEYWSENVSDVGIIAPLYYGVKPDPNGSGRLVPLTDSTLTLQIGDYFIADGLLVQSISNVTFSKEIIAPPAYSDPMSRGGNLYDNSPKGDDYGYPLWGKCTMSLVPYSMVTKEKFQSWFRYKSVTNTNPLDAIERTVLNAVGIDKITDTFVQKFKL